jgi:hypothetical protein
LQDRLNASCASGDYLYTSTFRYFLLNLVRIAAQELVKDVVGERTVTPFGGINCYICNV